jgi:predicted transcriptional regulator
MLTPEQIRQRLHDANLRKVADRADVKYATLWRLMNGASPKYHTVRAISDYLTRSECGEVANG